MSFADYAKNKNKQKSQQNTVSLKNEKAGASSGKTFAEYSGLKVPSYTPVKSTSASKVKKTEERKNKNTAWERSGKSRDAFDSAVRKPRTQTEKEEDPNILERLQSAAKSIFSGVASDSASAWGTLFQVRGGSEMMGLYEEQVRSIDMQIEAAQKQLQNVAANDPMRKYLLQDLEQLQSQRELYQKSVEANRKIGDVAVEAADQAAAYSRKNLEAAKKGLGPIGSAAMNLGTGLGKLAVESLSPLPTVGIGSGAAGAAATAYRDTLRQKEAQEISALKFDNKSIIESELEHRYEDNYDPQKALAAAALGLGGYLAGSGLSRAVGASGLSVMRNAGVQNRVLPNVITGGLSGVGFSAGMTGGSELAKALADPEYEPDWGQISTDAVAAFAFGAIRSAVRIARSSSQNKAFVDQLNQEVQLRYATVKEILKSGNAQQKAQGAASVMDGVERLRSALNNLQFVGAQKQVDSIHNFLNSIGAEMAQYLPDGTAVPSGSLSGQTVSVVPASPAASAPAASQSAQPSNISPTTYSSPQTAFVPSVQTPVGTAVPTSGTSRQTSQMQPQKEQVEEQFPSEYYGDIERELPSEPETPGMTIPTGSAADLEPLAKTLGESGQKAMTAFYDSDIPAADYAQDFIKAYNAGRTGTERPTPRYIGEPVAVAAYFAGQNDAEPVSAKVQSENGIRATPPQTTSADTIRSGLKRQNAVTEQGFVYGVRYDSGSGTYSGTITRQEPGIPNWMGSNARSPVYKGDPTKTRGEAIEDLIAVAERNNLFAAVGSADAKISSAAQRSPVKRVPMPEAETGKPFTATLYHGSGSDPSEIYMGVEYPVAGKGRYYAMSQEKAQAYGDQIDVEDITLKNPLVVRDDAEWRAVTQAAGWKYPNMFGSSEADVIAAADAMREYVLSSGHDGLVIQYDDSHQGDINVRTGGIVKTLDNVFGHDQVIVYQSDGAAAASDISASITDPERAALLDYKSSRSYKINAMLREVADISDLNDQDRAFVEMLDSALSKLPTYHGKLYRNLTFDDFGGQKALDEFMAGHADGDIVTYDGFTSTSTAEDGYPVEGKYIVHILIQDGTAARNVAGFGNNFENEAIYPRDAAFVVRKTEYDSKGTPTIYLEEVTTNGVRREENGGAHRGDHSGEQRSPDPEKQGETVQPVPQTGELHSDVREVPESNPARGSGKRKLPGLRAEGQVSPQQQIADKVRYYLEKGTQFSPARLFEIADRAYGGTMAEGAYTVKDAYDGMELAVNQYLMSGPAKSANGSAAQARAFLSRMEKLLTLLPTQTKRTAEMETYQQFSTPPNIAYLAAWAANVKPTDVVLEPSAGIGGLALWPKAWDATVYANELSTRRLEFLSQLGLDGTFNLNAEQIDNLLPDSIQPTVVIMNPPFSATAGRTNTNKTANAKRHIEQALERLQNGGRLVAILGRGMSEDAASFKSWWEDLKKHYNVRANIRLDGSNYKKYGTNFDVQLVVIDKIGPTTGQTLTGTYKDLSQIPGLMEGIRNERKDIVRNGDAVIERTPGAGPGPAPVSVAGRPAGTASGNLGTGKQGGAGGLRTSDGAGAGRGNGVRTRSGGDRKPVPGGGERTDGRGLVQGNAGPRMALSGGSGTGVDGGPSAVTAENPDSTYSAYVPRKVHIKGAKPHPAKLVESAAMAAVEPPDPTYTPDLPERIAKEGILSAAQLENVVYAGQAHGQTLANGQRKGFFIGDGTGVGKGRQIAGIIMDNFLQGRKKAVWISEKASLLEDARRDW